jgi:DNA helicase-2/ATP-dependent DNA helicase PcrA
VLIRANHHSALLELALAERSIPFVKYGGLRFVEAAHVKDLICTFRLADNPSDELAWFRVLQLLDGVGPATARRVIDALTLWAPEVLERWPEARAAIPTSARDLADELVAALPATLGEPAPAHAERLRRALVPLIERHYDDAASRLSDLETLVVATAKARRLSDVAAELTLEPPVSTSDLAGPPSIDEDWLVISTIHSAKGLEWDIVHLLNATDGNLPSDMALSTADGLEEERRLFYVAATRPRRRLWVYVPLRFHHHPRGRDDLHTYAQRSRFLSDGVVAQCDVVGDPSTVTEAQPLEPIRARAVDLALDALWT